MTPAGQRQTGWWLLILPAFLLMTAFYVAPVAQVLAISFTEPQPGFGNDERLFTSESVQRVIGTTLRICGITTVLALLLGYVLAYRIALAGERARRWWILAVLVPLWISVLVFIFSLGFYITPAILGGGKTLMVAEWVSLQILDLIRWGLGTMMATMLVVTILATLAVFSRVVDLRRVFGRGGRSGMDGANRPGWFAGGAAWIVAIYLVLPIGIIIPVSMTDQRFLSLPHDALSLRHDATVLGSADWLGSIAQSFWIALASTYVAVISGTLCAIGCWRISSRSTDLIRALMLLPIIIPSIVHAVGLYRYFAKLDLLDSFRDVVIAHGVTGSPMSSSRWRPRSLPSIRAWSRRRAGSARPSRRHCAG